MNGKGHWRIKPIGWWSALLVAVGTACLVQFVFLLLALCAPPADSRNKLVCKRDRQNDRLRRPARSMTGGPQHPRRRGQLLLLAALVLGMLSMIEVAYLLVANRATIGLESVLATRSSSGGRKAKLQPRNAVQLLPGVVAPSWQAALTFLLSTRTRYVIVNAKNGLGNRMRALASAMSVAESLQRPVLLIWVRDLHLNCSFSSLFVRPLPFSLLEEEIPLENLTAAGFQIFNYMRPEPGAVKDELVDADPDRHLYFRSAFVMNHAMGEWQSGGPQRQLRRLMPADSVARHLVADRSMVGIHIRNVFDVPREHRGASPHPDRRYDGGRLLPQNESVEGEAAMEGATREYGAEGTSKLLQWRRASHWTNFVPRMLAMQREHLKLHGGNTSGNVPRLRFYLAADSEDAYSGLSRTFPDGQLVYTRRQCAETRCDFRDCSAMIFSLIDLMNLAATRLILGSGYSSYSEVAAQLGGSRGDALPILMAGRDFGTIVERRRRSTTPLFQMVGGPEHYDLAGFSMDGDEASTHAEAGMRCVQQHWPRPF